MALAAALTVLMASLLPALKTPAVGSEAAKQPSPAPESDTPSVQTCKAKESITLKIPKEGSMAKFECDKDFVLYPTKPDEVFSKDCKTKETLSDMKRTDTPAAGTANGGRSETPKATTYTLTAHKKPSKKTLCYVCASPKINEKNHVTAEDYCTIHVESDARRQSGLNLTFMLALPCVFAALQFT